MQTIKEQISKDQLANSSLLSLVGKALDAHHPGWSKLYFPLGFAPLENDGDAHRLGLLFGVTSFCWGSTITAHCDNGFIKDPEGFEVLIKTSIGRGFDFAMARRAVVMVVAAIGADV